MLILIQCFKKNNSLLVVFKKKYIEGIAVGAYYICEEEKI